MDELQRYVEENLPDRFRGMKVFRVPVLSDSVLYWASYNNGNWSFVKATSNVTPLLIHNSMSKYGALYEKESDPMVDEEEDEIQELEVEEERPKGRPAKKEKPAKPERPVGERPAKPERPVKEKPAKKERPVKEKPERPAKKEKPVKERPAKKERPVRERPSRRPNEEELDAIDLDMNEDELDNNFEEPIQSPMNSNYSFVKNKVRKKLTGRIIFSVLIMILSGFTNILFTLPVILNSSKANKNINNPVEYWHYREKSGYLHKLNVLAFLLVLTFVIVGTIMIFVLGLSLPFIVQNMLGGLM